MQAPLLAHAMLHHPSAWPSQEAALGLLISLRKYYQIDWVRVLAFTAHALDDVMLPACCPDFFFFKKDHWFAPACLQHIRHLLCHCSQGAFALPLQMTLASSQQQHSHPSTSPMALLSAIVRKEALLPEHTAAFAATQLLPVIQAATERHCASLQGQQCDRPFCRELLVSADL